MTVSELVARLSGVRRNQRGCQAKCPAHEDHAASLSIAEGDDGRILLKCFAGCPTERVVAALGLKMSDLFGSKPAHRTGTHTHISSPERFEHSNGPPLGLTLAEYAEAKHLPVEFVRKLGLSDVKYFGQPAIRIPYLDADGTELAIRFRLAKEKSDQVDDRFRWKTGAKAYPYGLWRLHEARAKGYVVVVEGESDAHTLWWWGIPALGIPGANTWKEGWADYLDGIAAIFVTVEPDQGGEAMRSWLARSRIRTRSRLVELGGLKDPSALYLADPERFPDAWQAAMAAATPWQDLEEIESDRQAAEAYSQAEELLHDPSLLGRVEQAIKGRGYAGDVRPPLLAYVAMSSRRLERPQNLLFIAQAAAGKNRAVDAATELMPPEAVYIVKAGSARALIYTDEDFQHRVVIVSEADSIPEEGPAASALRSLAADNSMAYDVVERNEKTGRYETRHIVKSGPTGLVTTSVRSLGQQMGTRMLEVPLPDDSKQTRAVMKAHARSVVPTYGGGVDLERFIAAQRYLALAGVSRVAVPFADVLADMVPASAVRMRRDFRQLLTCIQAVAFLYQCQRRRTAEGWVEATLEDYADARQLLAPIFDTIAAEGVTPAVRDTVKAVEPEEEVSEAELGRRLGLSKATVHYRVQRALRGNWLVNNEMRKNHPVKLALGTPLPEATSALPTVDQVRAAFECSNTFRDDISTTCVPSHDRGDGSEAVPEETGQWTE